MLLSLLLMAIRENMIFSIKIASFSENALCLESFGALLFDQLYLVSSDVAELDFLSFFPPQQNRRR